MKLDTWKLQNPKVEIEGRISLPMSQSTPQNMSLNDNSFKKTQKKSIGGLISSSLNGTFIHTNTIEEYNAINFNEIVAEEAKSILND